MALRGCQKCDVVSTLPFPHKHFQSKNTLSAQALLLSPWSQPGSCARLAHVPGPPWQQPGILPLRDLNTQSPHNPATPLLISYPKLLKAPRLTAAFLTTAGSGEWPDCPPAGERVHNTWYIRVMEHHFTVRRNEVLIPATTWMKLKKSCSVKEAGHKRTNTGWFYLK